MSSSTLVHDQFAAGYDRQVREYHCFASDVLFGLCFEYVHPRERLLDLGIGTGLSALPFAQVGLQVFGADGSPEMLKICRSKNVAVDLKLFDIQKVPWPYADDSFDHVVSCGLLHFIHDLELIFHEVARVTHTNGVFAFTTKAPRRQSTEIAEEITTGVTVFMHSREYIDRCLRGSGFETLKYLKFLVGDDRDQPADLFWAFLVRNTHGTA